MKHSPAFSLVELSIVLVILGLLTGGILAGQSLIRAAELRTVGADIARYRAASFTFRDKYFSMPGDMTNATSVWGKDNSYCSAHTGTAATPGTCNGDGNGILDENLAGATTGETFQFWKQLALAGMIEGSYTGISGPTEMMHVVPGTNAPLSKIGVNAAFSTRYNVNGNASTLQFNGAPGGNKMYLGTISGTNTDGDSVVMKAEDAWNIDTKMDDGKPGTGYITTYNNTNRPQCANSDTRASAEYMVTGTSIACNMIFALE